MEHPNNVPEDSTENELEPDGAEGAVEILVEPIGLPQNNVVQSEGENRQLDENIVQKITDNGLDNNKESTGMTLGNVAQLTEKNSDQDMIPDITKKAVQNEDIATEQETNTNGTDNHKESTAVPSKNVAQLEEENRNYNVLPEKQGGANGQKEIGKGIVDFPTSSTVADAIEDIMQIEKNFSEDDNAYALGKKGWKLSQILQSKNDKDDVDNKIK